MNYPNPPIPELANTEIPAVKAITNELLKELESVLNNATLWREQVSLSLKGVVRILEVLTSMDFFKNAKKMSMISKSQNKLKHGLKKFKNPFNKEGFKRVVILTLIERAGVRKISLEIRFNLGSILIKHEWLKLFD